LENNIEEATDFVEFIKSAPGIEFQIQSGDVIIPSVILEILGKGHGQAFCKHCRENYKSEDLQPRDLGLGPNPLRVKGVERKFSIRRWFRGMKRTSGRGGKRYLCPRSHELIAVITWIS
jgi:hypothetical protein